MGRPSPLKALAFAVGMAMLTALLASLAMVPVLAFFAFVLLLPAPLLTAWVYLAYGPGWSYGSAAMAVLFALLLGGGVGAPGAIIVFVCVLGGIALGAAVAGRARPLLAGVMVTFAMLAGTLLVMVVLKLTLGGDMLAPLRQTADELAKGWGTGVLLPDDQRKAMLQKLPDYFIYMFPSGLLLFFSGCALAIYVIARWTLGRRYDVQPFQPFAEWRFPRWLPWLFVPGLLLWLIGLRPNMRAASRLGDNFLQVMNVLLEVQGLAVVFWWLRKRLGRTMSGLAAMLVAIIPYASMLLIFLGIWDALFDFRKLEPRPER